MNRSGVPAGAGILICLKDRKAWNRACRRLRLPAGARVVVAPLTEDETLIDAVVTFAGSRSCPVQILRSQTGYREICLRARDKLMAFTAHWPEQVQWHGRNFRELFVHRGDLSWWWLAELSQRNGDDRPTFGWMCELELLRYFLEGKSFDEAVVCVDNVDVYAVMCALLQRRGIRLVPNRGRRPLLDRNRPSLIWLMRWRDFWGELSHALAVKWACRGRSLQRSPLPDRTVVWHSWYPLQWLITNGRPEDRYYLHIPDLAEATGQFRSSYLATVRGPIAPWSVAGAVRQRCLGEDFDYVQRYSSIRDWFRAYFDFWPAFRYWALENLSRRYRTSFRVDGINLFPILRHDMRFSYWRNIPRLLATAEQFRRYAALRQPDFLVTYLELHCYGRAVIYGVKSGSPNTRVIGYQHSAITPMKLVYNYGHGELRMRNGAGTALNYMPLPDRFVVHGPAAQRILAAGGYPLSRIDVAGIARLDYLYRQLQGPPDSCPGMPAGCKVVVIATPIWPDRSRRLTETAIRGLRHRDDVFAIFKLHPAGSLGAQQVHYCAAQHGFKNYRVWNAELYRLIRMADVLFTMSSTTGAEALAMGVPVIHLQSPRDLDLSPFFEIPDAAFEVSNVDEFQCALDLVLNRNQALAERQKKWAELVTQTFYAVDGRAGERFVEVLSREVSSDLISSAPTRDREILQQPTSVAG
jgi:surface carbohydrate biosynthesis protein (TIGR04326 family)